MKKKIVPVLAAVILIVIVAIIGIATKFVEKYTPTKERMSIEEYFGALNENELALVLNNQISDYKGLVSEGVSYIPIEAVQNELNNRFFWDAANENCIYTTPDEIITIPSGSKEYEISGKKVTNDYEIVMTSGEQTYLAAEFVQQYTNMEFSLQENPGRLVVTSVWGEKKTAVIQKDDSIRYQGGIKSPILTDVKTGDKVVVLEEMEDWTKVGTEDGYMGYIKNDRLSDITTETTNREFEEPVYTNITKDYKINLVWHQITNEDANTYLSSDIAEFKDVNTISPTWFSIKNNEGDLTSFADKDYVDLAHQNNMEVWALIDNFSTEIDTTAVLNSTEARSKIIKKLISSAKKTGFDGINVDFESIPEDAANGFMQFIRELSVSCRKNKLVLSIDNPVPQPFTAHYNRKEQGIVADYVIIMGYDEHYVGSEAGSVASMPFVKGGVESTIAEVPAEKVINGIPFYTRLWKTETLENGSTEVTSEAIGMDLADEVLTKNNVTASWDDSAKQDYAEFTGEDGSNYKIWLENEKSIEEKVKLVSEYKLAGVAAWKLGYERASIWDVISTNLK